LVGLKVQFGRSGLLGNFGGKEIVKEYSFATCSNDYKSINYNGDFLVLNVGWKE